MEDSIIRFKIGEHYGSSVCLGRVGRKETYVFLPFHRPGTPMPEYWPRGKSGISADWYRVKVEDGVEIVNSQYEYFRADSLRDNSFEFDLKKYESNKTEQNACKQRKAPRSKKEKPNALAGIVLIVLIVLFVRACCS